MSELLTQGERRLELAELVLDRTIAVLELQRMHEAKRSADQALAEWINQAPAGTRFDISGYSATRTFYVKSDGGQQTPYIAQCSNEDGVATYSGCILSAAVEQNFGGVSLQIGFDDSEDYFSMPVDNMRSIAICQSVVN